MNIVVRIPAEPGEGWKEYAARSAIGKPLLDRVGDHARQIGVVRSAYVERGDLVATIELLTPAAVEIDLPTGTVRQVALGPARPLFLA